MALTKEKINTSIEALEVVIKAQVEQLNQYKANTPSSDNPQRAKVISLMTDKLTGVQSTLDILQSM